MTTTAITEGARRASSCTSPSRCSAPVYPDRHGNLYDSGYWDRYEGKPRPGRKAERSEREGWDDCDRELRAEQNTMLAGTSAR
jgi:hypothetical protein